MAGTSTGIILPDLEDIKRLAKEQLIAGLQSVSGKKDLVLDVDLMKPLDRLAGASFLKAHGVDKIFKLEPVGSLPGCEQRIYLIRPRVELIKIIAQQINSDVNSDKKRTYKILMVPRKLYLCERILEQEGVLGHVTVEELPLDFVQLDRDVLSLEFRDFFRSFFLHGDHTWCHTAAAALVRLQQLYSVIPNVYGFGRCSKIVQELMENLIELEQVPKQKPQISHLFLFDRDTDYVTPLCSQVTYEGLLDDCFGITSGYVEIGMKVGEQEQTVKLLLTSDDPVYDDIRDRHFSNVLGYLSQKAKQLQQGYDKRHNITSVGDMKNFVSNDLKGLKQQHKSLTLHVGACEVITDKKTKGEFEEQLRVEHSMLEGFDRKESLDYVEEIINRQYDMYLSLRLLCLLSLTQGGLGTEQYRSFQRQFLQSYGHEHLLTLHNLKRLGLLVESQQSEASRHLGKMAAVANVSIPKSSPFRSCCKKLNLIPKAAEEINLQQPNDMSYVFSGAYTPMLCKLVEQVLSKDGLVGMEDVTRLLPGPVVSNVRAKSAKGRTGAGAGAAGEDPRVALVFFLGGCTYTEIAALRFLGKQRGYKFIIATTALINGPSFLKLCAEKV